MNKLFILSILLAQIINIKASTTKPDSTYCSWYDLSIEFWENQNRRYYEYNENELIINEYRQAWNAAINDWENQRQFVTSYDENNLVSEYKVLRWDTEWINDWHETFVYNTNRLITEWTSQNWNNTSESWTGGEQYSYEYNTNNSEISRIYREWNSSLNNFKDISRWLSTYDAGILSIRIFQELDNLTWVNQYRYVYSYNSLNQLISSVKQNWNSASNRWESDGKTQFEYDNAGNVIEKTDQFWNNGLQLWINDTRYIYDFTRDTILAHEERQFWQNEIWVSNWKNEFNYNAQGLKTELIYSLYSINAEDWVFSTKNLFDYNENRELIQFIAQNWDENLTDWLNDYKTTISGNELVQTELFENWDTIRNDWVYENKCIDYYSWPASIGKLTDKILQLEIYPNPTKNSLKFNSGKQIQEIQIYSIEGKLMMNFDVINKQEIDINTLPSGQYILKGTDINRNIYYGKFIKN